MGDWLLKLGIGKLAALLDGYKLYVVGTGFVLKGLLGLIGHYWPDSGLPAAEVTAATEDIMIGIGVWAGKSAIKKSGPVP